MAWADFWEMLDGRLWWEMLKSGKPQKRQMTEKQIAADKDWLGEQAKRRGWT
jgi:hypothetical protein